MLDSNDLLMLNVFGGYQDYNILIFIDVRFSIFNFVQADSCFLFYLFRLYSEDT